MSISSEPNQFEEFDKLRSGLGSLCNNLTIEIDRFLKLLDNAADPIQVLTSDKGRFLLTNPFVSSSELINIIIRNISLKIYSLSQEQILVVSATVLKNKELRIGFGETDGIVLAYWDVFSNTVTVPAWDKIISERYYREALITELEDKEKLLFETGTIVKTDNGLLHNGYLNLYIKKLFRRKKFDQEVNELLDDLRGEVEETRSELSKIRDRDIKIIESDSIKKTLDFAQLAFIRFPKIDNYKYYERMKSKQITGGIYG